MTPGARLQAAAELLGAVWGGTTPPDVLMDDYFRQRRYAGSSDRRAIQERIYGVLRRRARLSWWVERTGIDLGREGAAPDPRALLIAALTLEDRTSPDEVAGLFSGDRHCPAALSTGESDLAEALYGRPLNHAEMPPDVAYEFPAWMTDAFTSLWGGRLAEELAALNETAPVDLRANTLRTTREEAKLALARAFVDTAETPFSPLGLRVEGRPRLGGTEAFKQGLVEIQDEGSQLLALLTDARPGMTVVDYCAGVGGKTLALAAAMGRDGRVAGKLIACDISRTRLDRLRPRLKRAGAHQVKCRVISAQDDNWVAEQAGRADRVLVDAPCTGTGTWRRDPNAKWRFTPTDLDDLVERQRRILTDAQAMVRPGGRLVYATCSLLPTENEQQMAWFLEHFPHFQALPIDRVWSETIGGAPPPTGPGLRLTPASTGTDGFFCSVLESFVSPCKTS
jgi:16S rRNA (cytosine967-C5)-methyltransferase